MRLFAGYLLLSTQALSMLDERVLFCSLVKFCSDVWGGHWSHALVELC